MLIKHFLSCERKNKMCGVAPIYLISFMCVLLLCLMCTYTCVLQYNWVVHTMLINDVLDFIFSWYKIWTLQMQMKFNDTIYTKHVYNGMYSFPTIFDCKNLILQGAAHTIRIHFIIFTWCGFASCNLNFVTRKRKWCYCS